MSIPKAKKRFSLLTKISLLVVGALALLAVASGGSTFVYFRGVLKTEASSRARAIAITLAAALPQMPEAAQAATIQAVRREAALAYVEVVTASGAIVAHTFAGRAPAQEPAQLREPSQMNEVLIDGAPVLDVPARMASGSIVHVGLDPAAVMARLLDAQKLLLAIALAALLVSGLLAVWIGRGFVTPLRDLTAAAARMAEGDLTGSIPVGSNDEVGELASAFTALVQKLKEVLGALQDSVRLLTEAGNDLSSSTAEQGQTITRQATALQETQVTAQEIKQTSLVAAQKAEAVLKLTEKADEVSISGEQAIENSLGGLTDIRAQVDQIAAKIVQLSARTQQIGGITQSVKDLADQSNMLALNAAIEAVRSGEHGKGFAVVAREIRSLADQSIEATTRVREILEDIGSAIRSAVAITESGSTKIDGGLLQVKASGENLRALSRILKDNSSAVRQIAAAVSQQNAGITQIFSAVTDQTRLMDETMQRLETTTQAAGVLKDLSERVSEVVKRFRL